MNSCNFIGRITEDLILESENGATVLRFLVTIEEVHKDRLGMKKKTYNSFWFEAWDTGAEAIHANCSKGSFIGIEANARFAEDTEEVYFRVKNFKVFP